MSVRLALRQGEDLFTRFGNEEVPVDVATIAERLGISVLYEDLGTPDISGVLVSNRNGTCILIQRADHPNRQRFSIAHEIGHHVLKHQFEEGDHVHVDRGNYISRRDPRSAQGVDPKEIEANWFAGSLLMPERLLRSRATALNGDQALLDHHVLRLAKEFGVSEQAMTIRLTKLNLL